MKSISSFSRFLPFVAVCLSSIAGAQTGTQDQVSPTIAVPPVQTASFNGDAASLTWQAEVRAGLAGQLEGFTLQLSGNAGATLLTSIRLGPGWNTSPTVFQTLVTKTTSAFNEDVFVNVTSANITVAPGTHFVIEMQGQGTGCGINGTYAPPSSGAQPAYPELLYLNGPGCFADCGWRIGFQTWVLSNSGTTFCFGDGSGTACPCGNAGASGNGCASSVNPGGANLAGTGVASVGQDSLTLNGTGMPNSTALYFQGTTQTNGGAGAVFGDGLRCAGGSIVRLGTKLNAGGSSAYPSGADQPVHVRGSDNAGDVRTYQCWYRNAAAFCSPSTFNLTNGVQVVWAP
jgi:hypothetical protein